MKEDFGAKILEQVKGKIEAKQKPESEKDADILGSIGGLKQTLSAWCDVFDKKKPLLSEEEVVKHMAENEDVKNAVFKFLNAQHDYEVAETKIEDLEFALKQLEENK